MIDRSLSGTKKTSARMSRRRRYPAWPLASGGAPAAGAATSAVYPAPSTAATSVCAETASGAVIVARSVAKLTAATTSGPITWSFFSIRAAHAAQVIPRIDSSILRRALPSAPAPRTRLRT